MPSFLGWTPWQLLLMLLAITVGVTVLLVRDRRR
jgi:hypothetical protein